MCNFQRLIKNERLRKNQVEIPESWFLDLEFPRYITQFCRILMDGAFFSGNFRGKVEETKKKSKDIFKKVCLQPPSSPLFGFFLEKSIVSREWWWRKDERHVAIKLGSYKHQLATWMAVLLAVRLALPQKLWMKYWKTTIVTLLELR